jgi:hypothetical protein
MTFKPHVILRPAGYGPKKARYEVYYEGEGGAPYRIGGWFPTRKAAIDAARRAYNRGAHLQENPIRHPVSLGAVAVGALFYAIGKSAGASACPVRAVLLGRRPEWERTYRRMHSDRRERVTPLLFVRRETR